jgi:hypothetical protein
MYHVHDLVRHICSKDFSDVLPKITNYYASSQRFMADSLRRLRQDIAFGQSTPRHHIDLVLQKAETSSPQVAWDAFFVIAARNNAQPDEAVLYSFEIAWKANTASGQRWKLLERLSNRDLLLRRDVLDRVLGTGNSREWEEYLGHVASSCDASIRPRFLEMWSEVVNKHLIQLLMARDQREWAVARRLLLIILKGDRFVPGELTDHRDSTAAETQVLRQYLQSSCDQGG